VTGRDDPAATVVAFNTCINARDIDGLAARMADDYTFVDSAGAVEPGRSAGIDAWRGFFAQFPDYRNVFETVEVRDGTVIVIGRSVCSLEALDGPAIWTVRVRDGLVAEWRVDDDTPEVRTALGMR
jgi:ketosteroid isomerase-like protein